MHVLLLAGLGPSFKNEPILAGSLFDETSAPGLARDYYGRLHLSSLRFARGGRSYPLLRPLKGRGSLSLRLEGLDPARTVSMPHLTTYTLEAILQGAGVDYEVYPLPQVWANGAEPRSDQVDAALLSTTFIWDRRSLEQAIDWVVARYHAPLILGGQYSNLKYAQILRRHPEVYAVVRGDAEVALPRLLAALNGRDDVGDIPNVVFRDTDTGRLAQTPVEYIDLDAYPSPMPTGSHPIVPYESMRGCPFRCKFCSFPHASPLWRYKSATKISQDWRRYRDEHGALHIRASDSTFTVPPTRLRQLLDLLPDVGVGWEAFTRANAIKERATVDRLAAAHCKWLSIGFESMSENTLSYMDKRVTAKANRTAFELLRNSDLGYRISFMVGYPGEDPDDYRLTHDFLVDEYAGHFMLNVFSLQDETMPVWEDADRFQLMVLDPEDPDYAWQHAGMDVSLAHSLLRDTLDEVRWRNDRAVHLLWQKDYETPLIPGLSVTDSLWLEKLVERFAMLPLHEPEPLRGRQQLNRLLGELARAGVSVDPLVAPSEPRHATDLGF